MNYPITIGLLLLFTGGVTAAPALQTETLVGSVVRYDASMISHTSQADFVIKSEGKGDKRYVRLRYAPNGFGFDAPRAKPDQLLPKDMFADANVVWSFHPSPQRNLRESAELLGQSKTPRAHAPRNREEQNACTGLVKQYAPSEGGQVVEVERFVPLRGQKYEPTPKAESLPCLILEGWAKNPSSSRPKRDEVHP